MNKNDYKQFHARAMEKMRSITEKKNSDYTGASENAFANFQNAEALGICSLEAGILVRMTDKMSRLASFIKKGSYEVADESFEDTCLDLANYAIILAAAAADARARKVRAEYEAYDGPARSVSVTSELIDEEVEERLSHSTRAAQTRAP